MLFKGNKAVGIEFEKLGTLLKALAKKGVILSAGAVGTPKLLMLSGIGPKAYLQDLKVRDVPCNYKPSKQLNFILELHLFTMVPMQKCAFYQFQ